VYEFKAKDLKFSKGGLDELIGLDRYAVSSVDPKDLKVGDTVIFIADEKRGTRKVGTILNFDQTRTGNALVVDREGHDHIVAVSLITKPLETTPQEFWSRWAYGGALVEETQYVDPPRLRFEDEFRWLFDGYRYSPGGRIQLGLGHEYLGKAKSSTTLVNCFVGEKTKAGASGYTTEMYTGKTTYETYPIDQWRKFLVTLRDQIEVQRKGGGKTIASPSSN